MLVVGRRRQGEQAGERREEEEENGSASLMHTAGKPYALRARKPQDCTTGRPGKFTDFQIVFKQWNFFFSEQYFPLLNFVIGNKELRPCNPPALYLSASPRGFCENT